MSGFDAKILCVVALLAAGLLGVWVAWACHRARQRGVPAADAVVWAGLAAVFVVFAQLKLAKNLGLFHGMGWWLRTLAKQHNLYADRRPFQIAATLTVAVIVGILLLYGLAWLWHAIKRYRLAIGFASMAVGFAAIRFISLHEVDSWNADLPWASTTVELIAAMGASAIAIARLRQLGEFSRFWRSD